MLSDDTIRLLGAMLFDSDALPINIASVGVMAAAIVAMLRASARGALGWKRAVAIVLLGGLAITAVSIVGTGILGPWHAGHLGDSIGGYVVWVIMHLLLPLPAWLAVGTAAAVILCRRSARSDRATS